jgi:hypothetical protein
MTKLLNKFQPSQTRTEAQAFFDEAYSFPGAALALAALALGDVAIAVSMVVALG